MKKLINSVLVSSLFLIKIFANNEQQQDLSIQAQSPIQTQSQKELNTLDKYGYSPLHKLVMADKSLVEIPHFIRAIKNAKLTWTHALGESSYCGTTYQLGSVDPYDVAWDANLYSKDKVLEVMLAEIKEYTAEEAKEVKSLLQKGAYVDFPDAEGRTALWWAAERNNAAIASTLIEEGANVNSNEGVALCFAADNNNTEMISTLIEAGANVNGNDENTSPLHIAAVDGNKEAVECLLVHGANPNFKAIDGSTPLHAAALGEYIMYNHLPKGYKHINNTIREERLPVLKEIIDLLIKYGALINVKNNAEQTPSQMAREYGQKLESYPEPKKFTLAEYIETLTDKPTAKK